MILKSDETLPFEHGSGKGQGYAAHQGRRAANAANHAAFEASSDGPVAPVTAWESNLP